MYEGWCFFFNGATRVLSWDLQGDRLWTLQDAPDASGENEEIRRQVSFAVL